MTFLLDTNVISELRKPRLANPNVRLWAAAQDESQFFCSCISILEVEIGALRAMRRDRIQGDMLRTWIDDTVLVRFKDRIVSIDEGTALRCAALHVPDKRPDRDAWIAATALVHDMTVVTRNTKDFAGTGVRLIDPWSRKP